MNPIDEIKRAFEAMPLEMSRPEIHLWPEMVQAIAKQISDEDGRSYSQQETITEIEKRTGRLVRVLGNVT